MSFWEDLEEMQKEIEHLDSQTNSKNHTIIRREVRDPNQRSQRNSVDSTTRIRELETRAKQISSMIDHNNSKLRTPRNADLQKSVDMCVTNAEKSHDANVHLMQHLSVLEGEISKLTQKEDMWHDTAKLIQTEVESLRTQIGGLKPSKNTSSSRNNYNYNNNSNQQQRLSNPPQRMQSISSSQYRQNNTINNGPHNNGNNNSSYSRNQTQQSNINHQSQRSYQQIRGNYRNQPQPRVYNNNYNPPQQQPQNVDRVQRIERTYVHSRPAAPAPPAPDYINQRNDYTQTSTPPHGPVPLNTAVTSNRTVISNVQHSNLQQAAPVLVPRTVTSNQNAASQYQLQRSQKENAQLNKENQTLQRDIANIRARSTEEKQSLQMRVNQLENQLQSTKMQLDNKDTALQEALGRTNELEQQIIVLRKVVEDYDRLKEAYAKLQLDHQRALQDVLEARKEKSMVAQQLASAQNHIQELEIKCRKLSHEKLAVQSEMRAQKQVNDQDRKNMEDRYERTIQKQEAELSYVKKMYQEIKRKYRALQHKFETEQPQYQQLKEQLDTARDKFTEQLNDVVVHHVSKLDQIAKQSEKAADVSKYVEDIDETRDETKNMYQDVNSMDRQVRQPIARGDRSKRVNGIWEPI